ncbi:MAG: PD-(D/E)XK nuclease family transposase [Desulfovibrio sp.]|nr:PD-(D/E)XK nuclease family transposase [Desulfovibrio sp.]
MTLWDDVLFRKAAEDNGFCAEMLQTFLDDPKLTVVSQNPQSEILNLQGRSAVLDLVCKLGSGETVNVEVQKPKTTDHLRRVRYYSSLITTNITDPNTDFKDVPNLTIIYLTNGDIFKRLFTKYYITNTLFPCSGIVDDGLTRIFINGSVDDNSITLR